MEFGGFTATIPETMTLAGRNVANTFTVAQVVGLTALGTTSAPGISLTNSTAAAAGAQQVSPSWVLEGQGWKTTATAASQSVKFRGNVLPVQGAANPTGNFLIQSDINNTGSWTTNFQVTSAGLISTSSANTLSLGTDPTFTQGNSGRPIDLRSTSGFVNISDGTLPQLGFTTTNGNTNPDSRIARISAGVIGLRGTSGTTGATLQLEEQTAPAAGATNTVRIYAQDNGAGKTQLMAIFPTGAAQQLAIEP